MAGAKMDEQAALGFCAAWHKAQEEGMLFKEFAAQLGVAPSNIAARRRRIQKTLGIELPSFRASSCSKKQAEVEEKLRAFRVTSERPTPEDERPIEEIVAERVEHNQKRMKSERARELVDIRLDITGPYGIAMIGDPHIDNPGCNLKLLLEHTDLIMATDGMFAVCVGDLQDNWVGRLSRLWAGQGIAARESQRMVEWWLGKLDGKLLAICEGNHDAWKHGMDGMSPLQWIESRHGTVLETHGVRLRLHAQDGIPVTINMRHDFPGRSQYNAAHGPNKSLLMGNRDDVAVAGHTHVYGHSVRLDPDTRKPQHAVRLGSYKHSDDYAREKGLLDNNVTECAVLMVDPTEADPRHRTWIETNPFRAAKLLQWMRGNKPTG